MKKRLALIPALIAIPTVLALTLGHNQPKTVHFTPSATQSSQATSTDLTQPSTGAVSAQTESTLPTSTTDSQSSTQSAATPQQATTPNPQDPPAAIVVTKSILSSDTSGNNVCELTYSDGSALEVKDDGTIVQTGPHSYSYHDNCKSHLGQAKP